MGVLLKCFLGGFFWQCLNCILWVYNPSPFWVLQGGEKNPLFQCAYLYSDNEEAGETRAARM